jgi:hypothetical protein
MGHDTKINPAVKAWLDNVLVPAMVRLYNSRSDAGDNCLSPSPYLDADTPPSEVQ